MSINTWLQRWDAEIADWIEGGESARAWTSKLVANVDGLDFDAMPEPYVGPVATAKAAVLMYNPGPVLPDQRRSGDLVKRVEASSYSRVAASWLYPHRTVQAWSDKVAWATRCLGLRDNEVAGLDLVPWHSHNWDGDIESVGAITWIHDHVLQTAAEIVRRQGEAALLLAVGADIRNFFTSNGWQDRFGCSELVRCGPVDGTARWPESWPQTASGSPQKWYFWLAELPTLGIRVLEAHVQQLGMQAPPAWADVVVNHLISGRHAGASSDPAPRRREPSSAEAALTREAVSVRLRALGFEQSTPPAFTWPGLRGSLYNHPNHIDGTGELGRRLALSYPTPDMHSKDGPQWRDREGLLEHLEAHPQPLR